MATNLSASTGHEGTIQSNIKHHTHDNLTDYALFVGGLNVTHDVLANYDPLRTGFGRLFMVRYPTWLLASMGTTKMSKFKHILEYGNTAVSGLNDIEVDFNEITGGYAGKSFAIPNVAKDTTNEFTVTCYEFSGSPIREVIWTWVNGTTDLLTGLTHYNGIVSPDYTSSSSASDVGIERLQSNQTAEFVYVATDHTGENVEYCCFLANCFPVNVKNDQFNYTSGEHNLVEYALQFRCTKYESMQINMLGNALLKRYKVLANSLNFYSGIDSTNYAPDTELSMAATGLAVTADYSTGTKYDVSSGKLVNGYEPGTHYSENTSGVRNSSEPALSSELEDGTVATALGDDAEVYGNTSALFTTSDTASV